MKMGWLRGKLFGGFGLIVLFLLLTGIGAYWNSNYMHSLTEEISEHALINSQVMKAEIAHLDFIQKFNQMFLTETLIDEPVGPHECAFGKWYDSFTPEEAAADKFAAMDKPHQAVHEYGRASWQLAAQGDFVGAEQLFAANVLPAVAALRSLMQQVQQQGVEEMEQHIADSKQAATRMNLIIIAAILLSIAVSLLLALTTANAISKPLLSLSQGAALAAQGDLTVRLNAAAAKGELRDLVNSFSTMMHNLKELIGDIKDKTAASDSASDILARSSEETSRAAEQIAVTIQDVAESGEKLSGHAEQIRSQASNLQSSATTLQQNAADNLAVVGEADRRAGEGRQAVEEAIKQLTVVTETVNFATGAIQKLAQRSGEIGKIVELIDGIATQTNLLALNAAIEAARAGETGRGFAVVAEQVRKLAEESAQAAKKITSLIEDIQSETVVTVNSMEVNAEEIGRQLTMIKTAGESLTSLVDAVHQTQASARHILGVSHSLQESGAALASIVETLGQAILSNAASAEEVAASAEEQTAAQEEVASAAQSLREITQELARATDKFKV